MDIQGSKIFITGANRGLGLALARRARDLGAARVYAGMRNTDGFAEPGLIPRRIDVTDPASIAAAIAQADDTTILVNNAGIAEILADALDPRVEEQSRRIFETNYYGVIRTTQAFAPVLGRAASSAILNVLSVVSWLPSSMLGPYAASKAAAWSYTNSARLALKGQNTLVSGLHVGFIDTDLTKGLDQPKLNADDVARIALDGVAAGLAEILADDLTRAVKASLSQAVPAYLDPSR